MSQKRVDKISTAESIDQKVAKTASKQKSIVDETLPLVREKRAIAKSHKLVVDAAKKKEARAKIELANTTEVLAEARDEANNDPGGFADYSIDALENFKDAAQSRVVGAKDDRKATEIKAKALDKDPSGIYYK